MNFRYIVSLYHVWLFIVNFRHFKAEIYEVVPVSQKALVVEPQNLDR